MVLYGISTCDTCKRAIRTLTAAGHEVTFRDIRSHPLTRGEIDSIVAAFGDAAVNRQSTTWRAFSDYLKASDPEEQIAAQPTVMKRPVIDAEGTLYLGWDDTVEAALV